MIARIFIRNDIDTRLTDYLNTATGAGFEFTGERPTIVGFPGEDEPHFQELCDFVEQARFNHLGIFTYSPEKGTRAARLSNPVPEPDAHYGSVGIGDTPIKTKAPARSAGAFLMRGG